MKKEEKKKTGKERNTTSPEKINIEIEKKNQMITNIQVQTQEKENMIGRSHCKCILKLQSELVLACNTFHKCFHDLICFG